MLKIEYVDINSIKPYENNAKEHPREQIEQIKKSIQEFGNNDPIAVWHNEIVEGHGRYEALKELNEKEIPIIRLDDLTDEQRKAYTLVHNKLTMNSDFDFDKLTEELDSILDINMEDFGFSEVSIDWSSVEEIKDENYQEPIHNMLECPQCHHIDRDIHFKKVATDNSIEKLKEQE
jgi:ParB-like chromosome segregation protein Spo0J